MTTEPDEEDTSLSPDEAFGLLGNDTRVNILQALWDAFESGTGDNELAYSELFAQVDYDNSGNFSYHLEKLTGPFIRQTANGYELKQTGINVIRAVVTGTITGDPEFGPTEIAVACPRCGSAIEIAYADEILTAACTDCVGAMRWNDDPGILYLGLVPPALLDHRSIEASFRAAVTLTNYQLATLHDGVCPHCAGLPDRRLAVCYDHQPGPDSLCSNCDRYAQAEAVMVCRSCKWQVFPPATIVVLADPHVTAFYHDHGIDHRFASWEAVARSFELDEELVSEEPLHMQYTVPAGDEELRLTLDGTLDVLEVER